MSADEIIIDAIAPQGFLVVFDVRQGAKQQGEVALFDLAQGFVSLSQMIFSPASSMLRMRRAIQSASVRMSRSRRPISSRGEAAKG